MLLHLHLIEDVIATSFIGGG